MMFAEVVKQHAALYYKRKAQMTDLYDRFCDLYDQLFDKRKMLHEDSARAVVLEWIQDTMGFVAREQAEYEVNAGLRFADRTSVLIGFTVSGFLSQEVWDAILIRPRRPDDIALFELDIQQCSRRTLWDYEPVRKSVELYRSYTEWLPKLQKFRYLTGLPGSESHRVLIDLKYFFYFGLGIDTTYMGIEVHHNPVSRRLIPRIRGTALSDEDWDTVMMADEVTATLVFMRLGCAKTRS